MKIKHYRPFFTGLLCWVLAAAVAVFSLVQQIVSPRHLAGAAILVSLGAVEMWFAFSRKSLEEEVQGKVDERQLLIATQSGHLTLRAMNVLTFLGMIASLLGYAFTRDERWITVTITLCCVIIVMFLVLLAANRHYERKY